MITTGCLALTLATGVATAAAAPSPTGTPSRLARTLQRMAQPSPTGDPFFDAPQADLAALSPGELIVPPRDVTPMAQLKWFAPGIRAWLLKFRTTDAFGAPSFGTATLLIPGTPWHGPGARPLLVDNFAIDSLGPTCTPSYRMLHTDDADQLAIVEAPPVAVPAMLLRGYAVLVPDHEGPHMAYADGHTAGPIVLDAIRATYAAQPVFRDATFAMVGYSGGAIATGWADKMMADYSPGLLAHYAGSALGGVPADFDRLRYTMDGSLGTGLYIAAIVGLIRGRYPELTQLASTNAEIGGNLARAVGLQNQCFVQLATLGATFLPVRLFATLANPYANPVAQYVLNDSKLTGSPLAGPLLLFNAAHDEWIPAAGTEALYEDQRDRGVNVQYVSVPGDHVLGAATGYPAAADWVVSRLG
ncbi:lipase family protein [Jongsikchunia kroppenstedtii]|uniref:lipase family protein n=1 Tax=Jongsikchunia kroppenstedtii TaxID=1121721 RepID=UPI00039FF521|nr:lipase family protein [Jongsikchunia kroppenstedtii]